MLLLVLLFCGLTLAQDSLEATDTEQTEKASVGYPVVGDILRELGAMREKVGALENRLKDSEQLIEELRSREKSAVMFSAAMDGGGDHGPFNTNKILIYNTVLANVGAAYNKFTGIFTAPLTGVYYITYFYHAGGGNPANLSLIKNYEMVALTSDHGSSHDGADNGGNAVLINLRQGDQVFVRMQANSHVYASGRMTSFSGFLLSRGWEEHST
ncbi:C1q-like 23 kDa protein [Scophthalmus maximus]|uniref:C1q-like 23 kDa protein n=1 Tax=Scophthalmus maximus TaxID=52904 RepID=A0A2U9BQQ9_SCOMX|nr:C1q-like 23 kDa protein [Scophthalmus maximus]